MAVDAVTLVRELLMQASAELLDPARYPKGHVVEDQFVETIGVELPVAQVHSQRLQHGAKSGMRATPTA